VFWQSNHLRVDLNRLGVATLWLDVQDQRYNVLNFAVLHDLEEAFEQISQESGIRVLVIRSAKDSGFLAGADINQFARVRSNLEAEGISTLGQQLFDRLSRLPAITLALIHGPCLGGGLELALACDYRWAVELPGTQLGLPEVELGLVPGWGGTQRLPRVVGLENALKLVLTGRKLNAAESHAWGLADRVVDESTTQNFADVLAAEFLPHAHKVHHRRLPLRTWRQFLFESTALGRGFLFRAARKQLQRKVPDDMPAPHEALRAIETGIRKGFEAGLAQERASAGRLATTPACRNLIGLFQLREKARKPPASFTPHAEGTNGETSMVPEIRRVGIVGAGTMGAGIAQLAAIRGFEVVVQEVNDQALAAGMRKIEKLFAQAVERKILPETEARRVLAAMKRTTSWEGFQEVDLVVEAVIEDLELKRRIFRDLESRTPAQAILATNTSSLLVRRIQDGLTHPERVAALHFFNPVHKMPLIEVAYGAETLPSTVAALVRWSAALGKTPVVVKDSPGFVVNRVLMPYFNEALLLLTEGVSAHAVDQALRRFGMPMGPLELLDQIGLDVAAHICKTMEDASGFALAGKEDRKGSQARALFERLQAAGFLGQKAGKGFYLHGRKRVRENPAVAKVLGKTTGKARLPVRDIQERAISVMVNEAAACLGEGIVSDAETIDLAMVLGTGWAPHRGGPLRYADDLGLTELVQTLNYLRQKHGPRFDPCEELRRRALLSERFYSSGSLRVGV
jgi:3-hydroxyacyl-CoA dehydrogenase/enoyl-CoA hydratase/3-hydroxybutyryl-CoA epimerase